MYLQLKEVTNDTMGLIASSFAVGLLASSLKCHLLIEKIGLKNFFSISILLLVVFNTLQALFSSPSSWIILRFFSGFFMGSLLITTQSWALALSNGENKSRTIAIYIIIGSTAQGLGPLMLKYVDILAYIPYIINIIFSLIALLLLYIRPINVPTFSPQSSSLDLFKILKLSPLGSLTAFVSGMTIVSTHAFLPIYGFNNMVGIDRVPLLVSCAIFGGIVFQWPIGYLADWFDRKKILLIIALALSSISLTIAFFPSLLLVELFIFGGFAFALYPLSMTHTSDHIKKENWTQALSSLSILYGIGAIIGPIITAKAIDKFGSQGLFYFFASISLLLGSFCFRKKL